VPDRVLRREATGGRLVVAHAEAHEARGRVLDAAGEAERELERPGLGGLVTHAERVGRERLDDRAVGVRDHARGADLVGADVVARAAALEREQQATAVVEVLRQHAADAARGDAERAARSAVEELRAHAARGARDEPLGRVVGVVDRLAADRGRLELAAVGVGERVRTAADEKARRVVDVGAGHAVVV
jgi:hypothetical protein